MTDDTTNPAGEVAATTPAPGVETDHPAPDAAPPRDEKGRFAKDDPAEIDPEQLDLPPEEQPPAEEFEEVDYEGKRYSVPKPLKKAILQEADYTRKTQELADQRRKVEAAFAEHRQAREHQQAEFEEHAALHALGRYLDTYKATDWTKAVEDDPVAANQRWIEYQTLKDQYTDRTARLTQKQQERALQSQREAARREEDGREALRREIRDWSPDLESNLRAFARERGVPNADDLRFALHPQETRILHDAYQYRQLLKKAQQKPKAPDPQPVKPIGQGRSSAPQGLSDDLPMDEWAKRWRAKQLRT